MRAVVLLTACLINDALSNWCDEKVQCEERDPTKGVVRVVPNVMCTYKEESPNDGECTNMTEMMADTYEAGAEELQGLWLYFHNTIRETVASGKAPGWPSAAGMKQLVWDTSLAEQAKRFNFQCNHFGNWCGKNPKFKVVYFTHMFTGDPVMDVKYSHIPEKVAEDFVASLIQRNRNLSYPADDSEHEIGQAQWPFMQMFYGKASRIGASLVDGHWRGKPFVQITTFYGEDSGYTKFYKQGEPCSRCPKNYECNAASRYPHLCAKPGYSEYLDNRSYPVKLPLWLLNKESSSAGVQCSVLLIVMFLCTLFYTYYE